jgi:CBS domain-containing protein
MLRVRDIMNEAVIRIRPDARVRELAHLLAQEQISGVPVVTERDRIVGVVSATDIVMSAATHGSPDEVISWLDFLVEDIMTPAPLTVAPEATVTELAQFLVKCRVHRALVTEGERLVGIVAAFDIMRVVAGESGIFPAHQK